MNTSFHPNVSSENNGKKDAVSEKLVGSAQMILAVVGGLLPILFVPTAYMALGYGKSLIMLVAIAAAVLFFAMAILRSGSFTLRMPAVLVAMWLVVFTTTLSAVFSSGYFDGFIGDNLGAYTVLFTGLMALVMTAMMILRGSKKAVTRLYALLIISAFAVSCFHLVRVVFGPEVLSLGLFTSATSSMVGGWNGLALFYGLAILLALVAVEQLPLVKMGKILLTIAVVLALVMLAVVNFFPVFLVLAVVSGVLLVYGLIQNSWLGKQMHIGDGEADTFWSSALCVLVLVFSLVFLVGGQQLGTTIAEKTGVNFLEVRPSFSATLNIGSRVYNEDLLYGAGPNKFLSSWRMYKNPDINETIFWSSNFESGYSYLLTSAINGGVLVALAWLAFLGALLVSGFRLLFRTEIKDRFWSFVGLSSFVSSIYFWSMTLVYVPSTSMLLLASVCTGVFVSVYASAVPVRTAEISMARHRNLGFVLIALVMFMLVGIGGTTYFVANHYLGTYQFNQSVSTIEPGDSLETIEAEIIGAYQAVPSDTFLRQLAFYQLLQLQTLQTVTEPTSEQQQAFESAVEKGVAAGRSATQLDRREPQNWMVLGRIYAVLAAVGVTEADERAKEAYATAKTYDPYNPVIPLLEAQLASQAGNYEEARRLAEESVRIRSRYTDALFFLTQLDVLDGNVEQAIVRTADIIRLEPQNPARRYQLGVLLAEAGRVPEAIIAFEQAVSLDSQYANARYFLALGYLDQGNREGAIEQLRVVSELNPDNQQVRNIVASLENGEDINASLGSTEPVPEGEGAITPENEVTSEDLETDLVTTDNPVPPDSSEEEEDSGNQPENTN